MEDRPKYYRMTEDLKTEPIPMPNGFDPHMVAAKEFNKDRCLARTTIDGGAVSTVFLVIDHTLTDEGPPILFETMAFNDETGEEVPGFTRRYSTAEEAIQGHHKVCMSYFGSKYLKLVK